MRKAFKVATAFTGAAACAAAFTPAAMAATATTAKTQQINPDVKAKNCNNTIETTSMVFSWSRNLAHGPTCVGGSPGGPGTITSLSGKTAISICTGNNWGWLYLSNEKRHFGQVQDNLMGVVGQVHISGWSGTYECPVP
jgi:hypothetical protein